MSITKDINGITSPKFGVTADVFQLQIAKDTLSIPHLVYPL